MNSPVISPTPKEVVTGRGELSPLSPRFTQPMSKHQLGVVNEDIQRSLNQSFSKEEGQKTKFELNEDFSQTKSKMKAKFFKQVDQSSKARSNHNVSMFS